MTLALWSFAKRLFNWLISDFSNFVATTSYKLKDKVYKSSPFDDNQSYLIWIHVFSIFDFYHEPMTDENPSKTDDNDPSSPSSVLFFHRSKHSKIRSWIDQQIPLLSRHTKCKRYHLTIKRIRQFPIFSSRTVLCLTIVILFPIITHSFTNF